MLPKSLPQTSYGLNYTVVLTQYPASTKLRSQLGLNCDPFSIVTTIWGKIGSLYPDRNRIQTIKVVK